MLASYQILKVLHFPILKKLFSFLDSFSIYKSMTSKNKIEKIKEKIEKKIGL